MEIALIGASGFVGSKILAEALERGHHVTAIVRNPEKIQPQKNLTVKKLDVLQTDDLARLLAGHDAVISSFNPGRGVAGADVYDKFVQGHKSIIAAVKKSGVNRFLGVGGAASLKTADGIEFLDSPAFPKEYEPYKPGIRGTRELYYLLKQEPALDWIFLSALVTDCARRAHRQVSPGQRPPPLRRERHQQNLSRGLRDGHDRRARAPAAPSRAIHRRILKAVSPVREISTARRSLSPRVRRRLE